MTTTVGRNPTTVTVGHEPRLRKLRWWQLSARTWSQYEIHLGLYRTWRRQPGDMACLPPRATRPLIWVMSAVLAIGDHYGHWFTAGDASVKLRPVNLRHGLAAKAAFLPTGVGPFASLLTLGLAWGISPLAAMPILLAAIVPTASGLVVVADAWNRGKRFQHHIDYISLDLVRHHRAARGSGAKIRDAVHQFASDHRFVLGGVASSAELRDTFYLTANGARHPDCRHPDRFCDDSDDCRRTIFDPTKPSNKH